MSTLRKPRELTGKHVLFCLLGFFGVVFAVNAVLVKAATSTFGGVETTSSYKAGLMFEQDVARAEQQDALHWQVDGKLKRDTGEAMLDISARDAKGAPLTGLTAQARLAHPADERLDRVIVLEPHGRRPISWRRASAVWPMGADRRSLPRRCSRVSLAQPRHAKVTQ